MRYPTGSILLHPIEDDHILQQVMLSRYISHEQLWKFARLHDCMTPRSTFNWRIDRLVKHGLLRKQMVPLVGQSIIYSVQRTGMEYLASRGECVAEFNWRVRRPEDAGLGAIFHSLGLNDLCLRLKETGAVFGWRWETEIRAHNELTGIPYTKDYDAIISLHLSGGETKFALEYERMAKSSSRYASIRKQIEAERNLNLFVYLAAHYNVLNFVLHHFEYTPKRVYFGLLSDFMDKALNMDVLDAKLLSKRLSEIVLVDANYR